MDRKLKKIALINPKRDLQVENPNVHEMFERNKSQLKRWFAPPLSLLIIASLTPKEIEIVFIDEHFEKIDFDKEYDLVGLTAMTQQANRAYEIARIFHKKKTPVVMGGIHTSVLPNEALLHVDTVFIGEAEETWGEFLKEFEAGTEKRIYQPDKPFEMAKSVIPRYELINYEQFRITEPYFKFLPVQATRGCPHDCNFCVVSKFYGKKIRKKPVSQVVDDIRYMQSLNFNSLIFFIDDNLFVDRKYAKELLKALAPLKIKFFAQSDVKVAEDEELLKLAYNSGCLIIFIGFESVDPHSLSGINNNNWKMLQIEKYHSAIKKIQENGIVAFGAFVFGFKHDNLETFENVRDFVVENNIPGQFTILTPLPGSRIYDEFKKEERLYHDTFWDKCSFLSMNFLHDNMTKEEVENKLIWLHDEVYQEKNVMKRNQHMMQIYKKLPPRWDFF